MGPEWLTLQSTTSLLQGAFYIVAGSAAALTYRHARRTVFVPLKSKVFEKQLEQVEAVLAEFGGKTQGQLLDKSGVDHLRTAIVDHVVSSYVRFQFDREIESDSLTSCKLYLCHPNRPMTGFRLVKRGARRSDPAPPDYRPAWDKWEDAKVWECPLPTKYIDHVQQISSIASLPLLPSTVRDAMDGYLDAMIAAPYQLIDALTARSAELLVEMPSLDDVLDVTPYWLLDEIPPPGLEQLASKELQAAVNYLGVEGLLSNGRSKTNSRTARRTRESPPPIHRRKALLLSNGTQQSAVLVTWPPRIPYENVPARLEPHK